MFFPVVVPYRTTPSMSKYDGPLYEPITDTYKRLKRIEHARWGKDLHGSRRPDLVKKACSILNVPETESIVEFSMNFIEDVAILHKGTLEAICFCHPSSWVPSERVGLSLSEIHQPVADSEMLVKMSQKIAETMATQSPFRRYVWTISTTEALSNHPKMIKPEVTEFTTVDNLYFRMETQTTSPMGDGESSLFFVKVETFPLRYFWDDISNRNRIVESINSMSYNILRYKNLVKIKDLLNK